MPLYYTIFVESLCHFDSTIANHNIQVLSKMKKILYASLTALLMAISAGTFTSCSDSDDPITVTGSGITNQSWSSEATAAPTGETLTFTFTASDAWTASSDQQWCIISPTRGRDGHSVLTATIEANTSGSKRIATITIGVAESNKPTKITISQESGTAATNDPSKMSEVNRWIYKYMCDKYLWNEPIPTLTLSAQTDYERFFSQILTGIDALDHMNRDDGHWKDGQREGFYSYIYRSAVGKSRAFGETTTGSGVMYMALASIGENEYAILPALIAPESPAAKAGLKRGSIITKIDNKTLTSSNVESYANKLYSGGVNVTFGEAEFDNQGNWTGIVNLKTVTISASSFEDPAIYASKVLTLANGKKVGYLCYMYFDMAYDNQLIDIFRQFKSQGIDELVIDLRYNGGGHVLASTVLGSLIAGNAHKGKVYNHTTYNAARMAKGEDGYYKFGIAETAERTYSKISEAATTSLDLNRIFVLCSVNTASASELVINGLRGVDVTVNLIGTTTNGKNVGMESVIRTIGSYEYELTPITFYSQNAKDFRDYSNGFTPDLEIDEGEYLYEDFGDENEPLFFCALQWINSGSKPDLSYSRASASKRVNYLPLSANIGRSPVKRHGAIAYPEQ